MAQTDKDLDRSLINNGYKDLGKNTYSRGNTTVYTDGSYWKKAGGSWQNYSNNRSTN